MSDKIDNKEVFFIRMAANLLKSCSYDENKAWDRVRRRTVNQGSGRLYVRWFKYAAIFVSGVGLALWGYRTLEDHPVGETPAVSAIFQASRPAELILATGQRVILDDSVRGRELLHSGMLVYVDSADQRLEYENRQTNGVRLSGYNTLNVPKGGEYALVLPDGTEVRLNSESSLRFPVAFEKGKREVYLAGEAFFKVKPDPSAPFHVHAAGRDVCVLGTRFDISAYANDRCFLSTLVSGKVKVSGGHKAVVLCPSEQYSEDYRTGEIEVKEVDVSQYTSWLEGKISFKGERLEDIVNKLKRWFEFEIFYDHEEVKEMKFRGVINKYDSFDTVLRNLEQTTDIRFSIQGTTVIARKFYNN